jgi:pilus assembly protein Flp/PilA
MKKKLLKLCVLFKNREGQAMVEYGLIIALVAIVVIVAITLLGNNLGSLFNNIAGKLNPTSSAG